MHSQMACMPFTHCIKSAKESQAGHIKRPKCLKSGRSSPGIWLSHKCFSDFDPREKKKGPFNLGLFNQHNQGRVQRNIHAVTRGVHGDFKGWQKYIHHKQSQQYSLGKVHNWRNYIDLKDLKVAPNLKCVQNTSLNDMHSFPFTYTHIGCCLLSNIRCLSSAQNLVSCCIHWHLDTGVHSCTLFIYLCHPGRSAPELNTVYTCEGCRGCLKVETWPRSHKRPKRQKELTLSKGLLNVSKLIFILQSIIRVASMKTIAQHTRAQPPPPAFQPSDSVTCIFSLWWINRPAES